jgi:hypothetical protein
MLKRRLCEIGERERKETHITSFVMTYNTFSCIFGLNIIHFADRTWRDATMPSERSTLNINVGVLGHVDSGKTSLTKALSMHLSTASLDKLPQSQQRGM